jgi:hypothetical protein
MVLLQTTAVFAQTSGESAEALFVEGSRALEEGRFPDAARLFTEVLEQRPHLGAAFNLAVALRGQGRMSAAIETVDALLAGRYGELTEEQQREVESIREHVVASLVTVSIQVNGAAEARLLLDGEEAGELHERRPASLRVDPGDHVMAAVAPDGRTARERFSAIAGRPVDLRLSLPPPPLATVQDDGPDIWPWLVVGALVVAAVVVTVFVLSSADDDPSDFFGRPSEP